MATWFIGKVLAIKGFSVMSIVFELVSKVPGRKQYIFDTQLTRGCKYDFMIGDSHYRREST
jgi:hypothetical protein